MSKILGRVLQYLPGDVTDIGLRTLKRFRIRGGRHIFDHSWDVLIILDACRYDMYNKIVGRGNPVLSAASTSTEWMEETFSGSYEETLANTAYISANPFSNQLDESRFGLVDHVWSDHWDTDLGTIPPEPVSDHGIAVARSGEYDRVILHYMQPHFPFIGSEQFGRLGRSTFGLEGQDDGQNVWRMVERGEIDADRAIDAYYDNLRYAYKSVETVLENVDGQVVITADHANALGEWNLWGHRAYVPFKAVREVPWDVRECIDSETYESTVSEEELTDDEDREGVAERLRSLGYVEE